MDHLSDGDAVLLIFDGSQDYVQCIYDFQVCFLQILFTLGLIVLMNVLFIRTRNTKSGINISSLCLFFYLSEHLWHILKKDVFSKLAVLLFPHP